MLGLVVLLPTAVTAQAGDSAAGGDRSIDKVRPAPSDGLEFPGDTPAIVKLNCQGYAKEGAGIVGCGWRAGPHTAVASWQLWNLQTRPEPGSRNLVAELGADVRSYRDSNVVVPAGYVYAILGLDADGDIVVSSRPSRVVLHERDRKLDILKLDCRSHTAEPDVAADSVVEVDSVVSIGCEWTATRSDHAVGYQVWRSVDGGDRHLIGRAGLDQTSIRDHDVALGHRYRYVVTAVDDEGHVVSRSRAAMVALRPHDRAEDRVREVDAVRDVERDRVPEVDAVRDVAPVVADRVRDRPTDNPVEQASDGQLDVERDHVRHDRPADH